MKNNWNKKVLLLFIIIGFLYRIYGLSKNYSFWTDENHLAIFVRAILERGKPILANGYSTGPFQLLSYYLTSVFAKVFGLSEWAIRLPSVLFGVMTILAVYLLGKEIFDQRVGLLSAFLITFFKIEILWSRQARPYQAMQFLYILGTYFLYRLVKKRKFELNLFLGFLLCSVLAVFSHGLGLVYFFAGLVYIGVNFLPRIKLKLKLFIILIFAGVIFLNLKYWPENQEIIRSFGRINNFFYYRVFLTHNYFFLCFLTFFGFVLGFISNKKGWLLLTYFILIQTVVASFFLTQPFSRYFFIIFPYFVLFASFGLKKISQFLAGFLLTSRLPFKTLEGLMFILLVIFTIFVLKNKFTLWPKESYSLNEDMQEIPEVDWKKTYNFIREKLANNPEVILIVNWTDLPIWYLGENYSPMYVVRETTGEKLKRESFSGALSLYSLDDFKKVISDNPKGLVVLDSWDDMIPVGVRNFSQSNLKKEFEIDRLYAVQPRYWTVDVYSWGY